MNRSKLGALLLGLILPLIAYADTKISALPAGTTLGGTEAIPAVQSAATVKTTPSAISTYVRSQSGANPSQLIGLTPINGSATTFLRSDGAPAIDQNIVPSWAGAHTF